MSTIPITAYQYAKLSIREHNDDLSLLVIEVLSPEGIVIDSDVCHNDPASLGIAVHKIYTANRVAQTTIEIDPDHY